MTQSISKHFVAVLLASAFAVLAITLVAGVPVRRELHPADIRQETGFAYTASTLSPRASLLLQLYGDSMGAPDASTLQLLEDGQALGPAHTLHDEIRTVGGGRFSHWDSGLIFSTRDNTDPRKNGRKYTVEGTARPSPKGLWLALACLVGAVWLERKALGGGAKRLGSVRVIRWVWVNVVPGLLVTVILVAVGALAGEAYFRLTTPFATPVWPSRFDPEVGFLFEPGAEVRHTNNVDFWMKEKANSLGFLDRDPKEVPIPDACRIAIIGDSFVEAAQVSNEQKVQTVVTRVALQRHPDWRISVTAFGYSGTGQLNQLPFYDRFARAENPALVVLVFASNDLANNSTILESIRNGWHPRHPPRLFAEATSGNPGFSFIEIDPDWRKHLLPSPAGPTQSTCRICKAHSGLKNLSLFYRWMATKFQLLAPKLASSLESTSAGNPLDYRREWLAAQTEFHDSLSGWDGTIDMDSMFYEKEMPALFHDALALTGFALDEFKKRADRDGARLIVLVTSEMSGRAHPSDSAYGRRYSERVKKLAADRGIPVLDQYQWIVERGIDPTTMRFPHDSHWSSAGHAIAADMLVDYLERDFGACPRREKPELGAPTSQRGGVAREIPDE